MWYSELHDESHPNAKNLTDYIRMLNTVLINILMQSMIIKNVMDLIQ